jgi:hypothetical protein
MYTTNEGESFKKKKKKKSGFLLSEGGILLSEKENLICSVRRRLCVYTSRVIPDMIEKSRRRRQDWSCGGVRFRLLDCLLG